MQPTLNLFLVHNRRDSPTRSITSEAVTRSLDRQGFDLLGRYRCERPQVDESSLRPGRDPAALPEGEYDLFVMVDLNPLPVESRDTIPGIDNGRLRYVGDAVRDAERWVAVHGPHGTEEAIVHMWYTPNDTASRAVVRRVLGDAGELEEAVCERAAAMAHPFPVLRPLTRHGISARTDLVERRGRPAICKVFKPGRERHLENELAAAELAGRIPALSPVVEAGKNWVVLPYYGDYTNARDLCRWVDVRGPRLVPWRAASVFVESVGQVHEAGFAHLDLHAEHLLIGPRNDVKIIDFEKLHRLGQSVSLFDSPMITGYDFTDDVDGVCGGPAHAPFDVRFEDVLGARLRTYLGTSPAEQITRRTYFTGRRFGRRVVNLLRRKTLGGVPAEA